MSFTSFIQSEVVNSLNELYDQSFSEKDFQINETKPEFPGDYTIVLFALVKRLKISPENLAQNLGENLLTRLIIFIIRRQKNMLIW